MTTNGLSEEIDTISAQELRHALGHLPTGVTVVTTVGTEGEPVGTTVSAVCSVSARPALLLVCLDRDSATLAAVRARGAFSVNVLAAGQHPVSTNFARPGAGASWHGIEHRRAGSGMPRLVGTVAAFECAVYATYDGGDHEILVGRIVQADVEPAGELPLLHWRGRYQRIGEP